jgi:PST family polysaccharide transporter
LSSLQEIVKSKDIKLIIKNYFFLVVTQFGNYLIPFLLTPFIIRKIGAAQFGEISYFQNVVIYTTLFINFGFEYTATRLVARNQKNNEKLASVFFNTLLAKVFLLLISLGFSFVWFLSSNKLQNNMPLLLACWIINLGFVLYPGWFFQGMEQMKLTSLFNLAIKIAGAVAILLFLHPDNYLLIPVSFSVSQIAIGFIAFVVATQQYKFASAFKSFKFSFTGVLQNLRESLPIFITQLTNSTYLLGTFLIVAVFVSSEELGYFSGIQKFIYALLMLVQLPLNNALFPYVNRVSESNPAKGKTIVKKLMLGGIALGVLLAVFVYMFAPIIVDLFLNTKDGRVVLQMQTFSWLAAIMPLSGIVSYQGLYANYLDRYSSAISIVCALVACTFTFFTGNSLGVLSAIWGWIIAQWLDTFLTFVVLRRETFL